MKIKIPDIAVGRGGIGDAGNRVHIPIDRTNINDFFQLDRFEVAPLDPEPFDTVRIEWAISPLSASVDVSDFTFDLLGLGNEARENIPLTGSAIYRPVMSSGVRINGRRSGGARSPLGDIKLVQLNKSNCLRLEFPTEIFDSVLSDELDALQADFPELRQRGAFESVVGSDFIQYRIPLKLVIDGFFDADLNVEIRARVLLAHFEDRAEMDLVLSQSSDAIFSTAEDIFSFGQTGKVEKLIERIVPLLLRPKLRDIERSALAMLFEIPSVRQARESGMRLLNFEFFSLPAGDSFAITFCPAPETSDTPLNPGGVVVDS
ncbi:MAG: hypothetical protein AAFX03_13085 [Pseudomonadota bacterium]